MRTNIIKITEIRSLYKDYCDDNKIEFSAEGFKDFLKFLEIDFYDWVRESLRQFDQQ